MTISKIMIIAGEKSGDNYGAKIVKQMISMNPGCHFFGTGGNALAEAGVNLIYHVRDLAYLGYWEPLKNFFSLRKKIVTVKKKFLIENPDLVILIDYPGFNLFFARFIKKHSNTPIIYYIPPTVWAWKEKRLQLLIRFVDHLIVIFPFEKDYYRQKGLVVNFFGHPLYNELAGYSKNKKRFCADFNIKPSQKIVAIMLGSRNSFFQEMAPVALSLIQKINRYNKGFVFLICFADSLSPALKNKWQDKFKRENVRLLSGNVTSALAHADFALCSSGTTSLEAVLLGCPFFFYARLSRISAAIGRLFYKKPWFSIANFILQKTAILEFVQEKCTAVDIYPELMRFFSDADFQAAQKDYLAQIANKLINHDDHYQAVASFILHKLNNQPPAI